MSFIGEFKCLERRFFVYAPFKTCEIFTLFGSIPQVIPSSLPVEPHQLDLFSNSEISFTPANRPDTLLMDSDALVRWKCQIATHQQRARESKPAQQGTLFNLAPVHGDPDAIDPFNLHLCPMSFYQLPADGPGQACIYFVLDSAAQLILYVGESCRSSLRWKGEHDCKRYIDNYQDLHHRHGLKSAVNITFWWDAPVKAKLRQQMELSLISKWRSPFNRENWGFWGAPFV